jgi:hypothetical protein
MTVGATSQHSQIHDNYFVHQETTMKHNRMVRALTTIFAGGLILLGTGAAQAQQAPPPEATSCIEAIQLAITDNNLAISFDQQGNAVFAAVANNITGGDINLAWDLCPQGDGELTPLETQLGTAQEFNHVAGRNNSLQPGPGVTFNIPGALEAEEQVNAALIAANGLAGGQ